MRLDHIAYRVKDRDITAEFLSSSLGYSIADDFEISFEDGTKANCYAMVPPERTTHDIPLSMYGSFDSGCHQYHSPPEIFVSHGTEGSIVWDWVQERGGVGGIHHLAYEVDSVEDTMREWREKGYAEFTTEEPLRCPDLVQCFTKPSQVTGVVYEFIERQDKGFCVDNVHDLMKSTKEG
jgi:catechol 2,3-dioxygenase-like lactoylglutathione lyase family enzyme